MQYAYCKNSDQNTDYLETGIQIRHLFDNFITFDKWQ